MSLTLNIGNDIETNSFFFICIPDSESIEDVKTNCETNSYIIDNVWGIIGNSPLDDDYNLYNMNFNTYNSNSIADFEELIYKRPQGKFESPNEKQSFIDLSHDQKLVFNNTSYPVWIHLKKDNSGNKIYQHEWGNNSVSFPQYSIETTRFEKSGWYCIGLEYNKSLAQTITTIHNQLWLTAVGVSGSKYNAGTDKPYTPPGNGEPIYKLLEIKVDSNNNCFNDSLGSGINTFRSYGGLEVVANDLWDKPNSINLTIPVWIRLEKVE